MTASLTIQYRRPTPIGTEVRLEARLDRVEGRKVVVSGRVEVDGVISAEAEGLFIAVDDSRFIPGRTS